MPQDPTFLQRTKHIELQLHWVCDLINNNILSIKNCRDPEQMADVLMKGLTKPKHMHHTMKMGVLPTWQLSLHENVYPTGFSLTRF
jgi:hypothetical protein